MSTHVFSVPYYMGDVIEGLEVPEPHTLLTPDLTGGSQQERMGALNDELADAVAATDRLPVVYAGDCVIILGVTAGLQRKGIDPVVVFYDAHGDFNTWETTSSGFIGGMPLAMLTGRGEQTIVDACGLRIVPDDDAVLVGARDLDPGERILLDASELRIAAVESVMAAVPSERDLYVHIDVDVVDPRDVPAVNYPAPGGPSAAIVAASVAQLAATGRVVAFTVSSWNPALEGAEKAAAATRAIAAPFL